jgi:hypothetical protein
MTLIISQASEGFGLQMSDRLVKRSGVPIDQIANKSILYVARDGIVAFSYTGTAFIEQTATDQWLAAKLTGYPYVRVRRPPMLRTGNLPNWLHVGPAMRLLSQELSSAFKSPRMSSDARSMAFEVVAVGWQWWKAQKRYRPILAGMEKPETASQIKHWHERHFGPNFFRASVTPQANCKLVDMETLRLKFKAIRSADDAEAAMVEAIRNASARAASYIGPDCMSILIEHPSNRRARVRYIGAQAQAEITSKSDPKQRIILPAAFSPWLIGPSLTHAPSVMAGESTVEMGGWQVLLEAPKLTGPGVRSFSGSITRPKI